jgi:hypothetical protein
MAEFQIPPTLNQLLQQELSPTPREHWYRSLSRLSDQTRETLLELLRELADQSRKAAACAVRQWESASSQLTPSDLVSWLDLGIVLSSHSSATAVKYFQNSVEWVGSLDPAQRPAVFKMALELADDHYEVILDFLAACPAVLAALPLESLDRWVDPGLELAEADLVLAVEYFRISPPLLRLIPAENLPRWVNLGMRLVVPNQFGKPDYLKVIEFFRRSPEIFSSLEPSELRIAFLELGLQLAVQSASLAIEYIRQAPEILGRVPSAELRQLVLEQGLRLGEVRLPDGQAGAEVVGDYLRQAPRILELMNHSISDFQDWVETGRRLLTQSSGPGGLERARAYFNRRSKTGLETTERLIGGVALAQVARVLALYAEGLSGHRVLIRSMEELSSPIQDDIKAARAIYLPERIRLFQEPQDNFRFYKVATLHEVGHLEFGTYDLDFSTVRDRIQRLHERYRRVDPSSVAQWTAEAYFSLYPHPSWAESLWEILEDARIDFLLRSEYPGVRSDMDRVVAFELNHRPSLEGLPPKQAVREALLQLSITDTTEVPLSIAPIVSQAYELLLRMKRPGTRAADSLEILDALYELLDQWLSTLPDTSGETDPLRRQDSPLREESDRKGSGQNQREFTNLTYRGTMRTDWVKAVKKSGEGRPLPPKGPAPDLPPPTAFGDPGMAAASVEDRVDLKVSEPPATSPAATASASESSGERFFLYDEWDGAVQDYRPRWSRLLEKRIPPIPDTFVQDTLTRYGGAVRLLRRYFETIKPEAFRKQKRQIEGEEMDLDALLEARIEACAGLTPTDRVYIKTEKRLRDVAVAFLLDMSGSTSQTIGRTGKRVIDVEKEGLVLLSEALQAVGDAYGIYAFSGQGKDQVEFYILKEFDEDPRWALPNRIGAIRPLSQNRDGIAIRHAVYKLLQQPARTKLLILLSDGKPLDTDYAGAYALQDTKMALREARMRGIHPYCITIDREASQYVSEMYGEVRYTIIDHVLTLPGRLPQIYRRLTT